MMKMGKHIRKVRRKKSKVLAIVMTVLILTGALLMLQSGWVQHWQPELYRQLAFWDNEESSVPAEQHDSESENPGEQIDPETEQPDEEKTPQPEETEQTEISLPIPGKIAYLTFDDGPSVNTPRVLDILKEYEIAASFFVIGNDSSFGHSMYSRIIQEGHAIGNHTYSHDYSRIYTSQADFLKDFYKLEDLLDEAVGIRPQIMRFPGGSANHSSHLYAGPGFMQGMTDRILAEGYRYYDWNVSSADSASRTPPVEDIIRAVKDGVQGKNEVMILFHDAAAKTTTVEALPTIIQYLQDEGYAFRAINEDTRGFRFQQPQ